MFTDCWETRCCSLELANITKYLWTCILNTNQKISITYATPFFIFHYILSNITEETEFYKSSYKYSFPQSMIRHKEMLIRLSASFIGLFNFAEYIQRHYVSFRVDNPKPTVREGRKTCLLCTAVIGQLLNFRTVGVHNFWVAIIQYLQKIAWHTLKQLNYHTFLHTSDNAFQLNKGKKTKI